MNFLTPSELRHTLKISRSTEHRLFNNGMPSIGGGRLRRYDQEAAVEWFRSHAHQSTTSTNILAPGDYQCGTCGFQGSIQQPTVPGPCPQCGSTDFPRRVNSSKLIGDR
jgi:hypothetical protein